MLAPVAEIGSSVATTVDTSEIAIGGTFLNFTPREVGKNRV